MGKVRTFKKYLQDNVEKALEEIRLGQKVLTVSTKYQISRTTLRRYVNQRTIGVPLRTKMGSQTVLSSQQEEILVRWLIEMKDRGFPVCREGLALSVKVSSA